MPLLQALIGLFELPEDDSIPDDEHFIEIEDTPGMRCSYDNLQREWNNLQSLIFINKLSCKLLNFTDFKTYSEVEVEKLLLLLLLLFTGYQTAYSQLAYAGKKERDPFSGTIPDAKIYLAQSLHKLSSANPGKVRCCYSQYLLFYLLRSFIYLKREAWLLVVRLFDVCKGT